jgi:maltooligosyltrehalose trehalohydrolase
VSLPDFAVWAPRPKEVVLALWPVTENAASDESPIQVRMEQDEDGWWRPAEPLPELGPEVDYGYLLDGAEKPLPDPRSHRQPYGVHDRSRTFDPATFDWTDELWYGRQLPGGVIYELHVGTFTTLGTLAAAIDGLDHLVELGVDFVELMPVSAFDGPHGWGYDGVLWYAVHEAYGGPRGYQQFVDACHERGLGVIQDVVYNHFGPLGNYLPQFGPYLVDTASNTWGSAVNLDAEDSDEVRRYILDNAAMWFRDFHVDGLRLDAVHALQDTRAVHILEDLTIETGVLSTALGRPLSLIAESDLNDPRLITAREGNGYGLTAQWNDDFHHSLYVSLTGDRSGYYEDYDSLPALAKVLSSGFYLTGIRSRFRGRTHGHPLDTLRTPTWRLVVYSDDHDQIGNRAAGERLSSKLDQRQLEIAALVTLLSPFTPMIFMGEEWGARTPWQFFISYTDLDLAERVAEGRLAEFAAMDWNTSAVPDPQDPATFQRSKLDWSELESPNAAELFELNRRLLQLRREHPDLTDPRFDQTKVDFDDQQQWLLVERGSIVVAVNFGTATLEVNLPFEVKPLLEVGEAACLDGRARLGRHSAVVGVRS